MKQLFFVLVITIFQISSSQQCAYEHLIQKKKNQEIFMKNYNSIYNYANSRISTNNQTYYIPVVFHIVYNNDAQNLPDSTHQVCFNSNMIQIAQINGNMNGA